MYSTGCLYHFWQCATGLGWREEWYQTPRVEAEATLLPRKEWELCFRARHSGNCSLIEMTDSTEWSRIVHGNLEPYAEREMGELVFVWANQPHKHRETWMSKSVVFFLYRFWNILEQRNVLKIWKWKKCFNFLYTGRNVSFIRVKGEKNSYFLLQIFGFPSKSYLQYHKLWNTSSAIINFGPCLTDVCVYVCELQVDERKICAKFKKLFVFKWKKSWNFTDL